MLHHSRVIIKPPLLLLEVPQLVKVRLLLNFNQSGVLHAISCNSIINCIAQDIVVVKSSHRHQEGTIDIDHNTIVNNRHLAIAIIKDQLITITVNVLDLINVKLPHH